MVKQTTYLKQHGETICLFKLQGFLFFGTAGSLYTEVMNAFDKPSGQTINHVVLDFSQVIGIDSSATLNFERLAQRAQGTTHFIRHYWSQTKPIRKTHPMSVRL
ncbi:MAG: SulP family sulfate permease [Porticoccaceae bacterium]